MNDLLKVSHVLKVAPFVWVCFENSWVINAFKVTVFEKRKTSLIVFQKNWASGSNFISYYLVILCRIYSKQSKLLANTGSWCKARENVFRRESWLVLVLLLNGWQGGANFLSQEHREVLGNQSKCEYYFRHSS